MLLKTHDSVWLGSGRVLLETDYRPGDAGPGQLLLRTEDQESFESVTGKLRLDPWIADEYALIEFKTGKCFLLCGAQAVVAVDIASLAWCSSVGLEYQEGKTIDSPWHAESEASRLLIVSTERRVWCVDEGGAIRWVWSCATSDQSRWIRGAPVVVGERVVIPLRTTAADLSVELRLSDGLPPAT
jgi:hypothetical protein